MKKVKHKDRYAALGSTFGVMKMCINAFYKALEAGNAKGMLTAISGLETWVDQGQLLLPEKARKETSKGV